MANIQDLMFAVQHAPRAVPAYALTITPNGSTQSYGKTIRSRRPIGEVRETVRLMAIRKWPQGFTFSVRPA
jgi:hypothetical protein